VDEPTDQIAQRLWEFCFAAVNGGTPAKDSSKALGLSGRTSRSGGSRPTQRVAKRG
jgi:hypothetical protein